MSDMGALILRDLRLALRHGGSMMMVVAFCFMAVSLFPFAVGPESETLSRLSVGIIWVCILLSNLLSVDHIFQTDYEDGTLVQLILSPIPLEMTFMAKCIAHWVLNALPLIILSPILGVMLNLPEQGYKALPLILLVGTPALSFLSGIGGALTVSLRKGGMLVALLILPLFIPVLIFGVMAVEAYVAGWDWQPHVMLLGGFSLFTIAINPWLGALALRSGVE